MRQQEAAHERIRILDEMQDEGELLVADAAERARGFKQLGLDDHQRRQRTARVGKDFAAALIAIHDRQRIGDLRAQRLHGGNPRADVGGSDRHQIGDMHAALAGKAGLIGRACSRRPHRCRRRKDP